MEHLAHGTGVRGGEGIIIPHLPFATLGMRPLLPDLSGPWHKSGIEGGGEVKGLKLDVCPYLARVPGAFEFSHLSKGRTIVLL